MPVSTIPQTPQTDLRCLRNVPLFRKSHFCPVLIQLFCQKHQKSLYFDFWGSLLRSKKMMYLGPALLQVQRIRCKAPSKTRTTQRYGQGPPQVSRNGLQVQAHIHNQCSMDTDHSLKGIRGLEHQVQRTLYKHTLLKPIGFEEWPPGPGSYSQIVKHGHRPQPLGYRALTRVFADPVHHLNTHTTE